MIHCFSWFDLEMREFEHPGPSRWHSLPAFVVLHGQHSRADELALQGLGGYTTNPSPDACGMRSLLCAWCSPHRPVGVPHCPARQLYLLVMMPVVISFDIESDFTAITLHGGPSRLLRTARQI